ncbi:hypothetical protein D3C87_1634980 [compost metagenome]
MSSKVLKAPHVMVGVQVIAADTDEKAQLLATTLYQRFLGIIRNQRVNLMPPTNDMKQFWSPQEEEFVKSKLRFSVIGSPETVKKGLQKLIDETQADELIIVSDAYDFQDRLNSFKLIAEVAR